MAFSVVVLGSGSSGNATLLSHSKGKVLLDAGLSGREICRRATSLGVYPESIKAIVVTHEHKDHTQGIRVLAKKFRVPVYISDPTLEVLGITQDLPARERIESGREFCVAGMTFMPFAVPHDSVDPLGFVVSACGQKLGVAMDLGYVSALVRERLFGCDGLIIESNHDLEMLKIGPYPWALKQRVMSRQGHLSNEAVAKFLTEDFDGRARYIFLAHLSKNNNHPDLARLAAGRALRSRHATSTGFPYCLRLTYQERPGDVMQLD